MDKKIMHLEKLNKRNNEDLGLSTEHIFPMYEGQSILNIPSTICKFLEIPPIESLPLNEGILSPLKKNYENVIFIMVDAMAYHRLKAWMAEEKSMVWNRLKENGVLAPITSISPSTTAAATTTFWTGTSPSQHGIVGYEVWLKEFGIITNMILHRPISFNDGTGNLEMAGFSPDTFLSVKRLGTHMKEHGVESHSFQHYSISNSGLSRSFLQDAILHPTSTLPDVWISLREMLKSKIGTKTYSWIYWGDMDGSAHFYGPDAERPRSDFKNFSHSFEEYFLNRIGNEISKNTLVIMGADHGQITTDKFDDHYHLANHPKFTDLLHFNPTGENRLAYLHIRPGKTEAVKEYINTAWPNQFTLLDSEEAMKNGLFGPGKIHPNLQSRVGDLLVISKGNAFLWWANKKNPLIGRHGGLSKEEMIVPFLAASLDKII